MFVKLQKNVFKISYHFCPKFQIVIYLIKPLQFTYILLLN